MRRLLLLVLLLVAPMSAQYPEVDALKDTFFAKNVSMMARHLPPRVESAVAKLTPVQKAALARRVLPTVKLQEERVTVEPGTGYTLAIIHPPRTEGEPRAGLDGVPEVAVKLEKIMSDGVERLVRINFGRLSDDRFVNFWLRMVDGEWRIYEIEPEGEQRIDLDTDEFLDKFLGAQPNDESAAVGALRTYNTAMVTYMVTYPDLGTPATLEWLGPAAEDDIGPYHAGLLDQAHTNPPFEVGGYRFTYEKTGLESYKIVARPLKFGGQRSFYTDTTGVIRGTKEDRDATEDDPPL